MVNVLKKAWGMFNMNGTDNDQDLDEEIYDDAEYSEEYEEEDDNANKGLFGIKYVARRMIDMVSGAAHVLDGHMEKISNSIFLVAPFNYDIKMDEFNETRTKNSAVQFLKAN